MESATMPNKTNLIQEFLPEKMEGKPIIDFLPNINPRHSSDIQLLSHWRKLFIQWKSPFILTEVSPVLWKLWKIEKGTEGHTID
jgi:hypothetical protein